MTTGPVSMPEEVRLSLAVDAVHPVQPGFSELAAEIQAGLGELMGAAGPFPVMAGTREAAASAAVSTLFEPGDSVIVIETGETGAIWAQAAEARNLDSVLFRIPWNEPLTPDRLVQAMNMEPNAKGVLMAASDASTGVEHPADELARAAAERGMLSVFEASASLGVSPVRMDEWGADCLVAGCDQGLGLPPGLFTVAMSVKAWNRTEEVKPGSAYLDLSAERRALAEGLASRFTPPVNMLSGLHTALFLAAGRGPEIVYAERRAMAAMCRAGARAMGVRPAAADHFAKAATSLELPQGVDAGPVLSTMAENYGVICSSGAGPRGSSLVLGHMGDVDYGDVLAALTALAGALAAAGCEIESNDYLERALAAFEAEIVEMLGRER
jgi:aspartate aminotransferase-like enzyme